LFVVCFGVGLVLLVVDAFAVGATTGVETLGDGVEEIGGVWVVVGVERVEFHPVKRVNDTSADERDRVVKVAVDAGDFGRIVSGWARPVRHTEGRVAAVERSPALRAGWIRHYEYLQSLVGTTNHGVVPTGPSVWRQDPLRGPSSRTPVDCKSRAFTSCM
jgi:hypothetical protein